MKRFGFMLAVLVLLAACQKEEAETVSPPRPVKSIVVQPFGEQAATFSGSITPQVSTDFSFQILGRIADRKINIGDTVEEGSVLATLDATVQEKDVQAAEAALAGAQASLANATGVAGRQRTLLADNVSTQAAVEEAEQALQAARSAQLQAEAALSQAREQLDYTQLIAGFPGIVTAVSGEAGQVISPGQTVVTVARPDLRDAVIDVPDLYAARLSLGAQLPVRLELDATKTTTGTVREIAPLADPVTRARRIRIALQNPPASFRFGSIVKVALPSGEPQALAVPENAVLRRGEQAFVWLVPDAADKPVLREVELRQATEGLWSVRKGLQAGDRIMAAGVHSIVEGQRVAVEEVAK
ncbi:efflux RND transporter periplasmic adaptor subunit [Tianweitania sediminis]|uniref:Efflux RND transporter periplasmic adaptor subunit n=1 Tax=Tianweitania sediminis TaxID=1502156 RepID=A0A8J7R241_9HYPH|nr:efflux RND transporter periplasmic adaptor subunit [Tianweitania sediminis]MBP0441473.1 efflux RND transporter periplasmic adaptor subunit [Tianweitania sediminis]